jgi:predicted dehydrogenase
MGYDFSESGDEKVLTHARAFDLHPDFEFVGAIDTDAELRESFTQRYGAPSWEDIEGMELSASVDVVVLATPPQTHLPLTRQFLSRLNPRVLFCEKPFGTNAAESESILELCTEVGVDCFVNYMRLSAPAVHEIRDILGSGERPNVRGTVWYSKGLRNSASHFINLQQHLFGDVTEVQVLDPRCQSSKGLEPDFRLGFGSSDITFLAARSHPLFHNALEWISSRGVMSYALAGQEICWRPAHRSEVYDGVVTLSTKDRGAIASDFQRLQWHVVDQLSRHLRGEEGNLCSGLLALETNRIVDILEN